MGNRRGTLVITLIGAALAPAAGGCASRHMIVAATGTNIGVEVSQNPANQSPQAKLGYQRTEFAIVPTNRSANEETKGGAQEHGDVIMELRYGGIFDTGKSSGIYQRLAVGPKGVEQPGAALMFSRDAEGNVSPDAAKALQALKTVPQRDSALKARVAEIARRACHPEVDKAIKESGLQSFNDLADYDFNEAQLAAIESKVSALEKCPE
jgi:hypothetical protein